MKEIWKRHRIKILCGLFYVFCLLNVTGLMAGLTHRTQPAGSPGEILQKREVRGQTEHTETKELKDSSDHVEAKKIAITFDDGPSKQYTGKLLDGLKERKVKATFFLIGQNVKENEELVKRIFKEGHLIGNHTYHHVEITRISDEEARREIEDTDKIISQITGEHVQYMRPPFGAYQKGLELEMEVFPVMWTIDPLDWTTENVTEIVNKVVTEAEENDIILLHDCYGSSVDAALQIIDILKERGFEFVTVEELMLN